MDYFNILGRAWRITWRWKILWVLGFLASLGSGGGGSPGNPGAQFSGNTDDWRVTLSEVYPGFEDLPWEQIWPALAGVVAVIICALLIIGILVWVISVIARGGLIAGVQQVEDEGSTSFRGAWRAGRRKFWTLFGVGVLSAIPLIILGLLLFGMAVLGFVTMVNTSQTSDLGGVPIIISTILIVFLLMCCILIPLAIVLEQIRVYGERAAILEDLTWIEAFKRGWQVLKTNLGHTIIFWILFAALGFGLFIVSFALILGVFVPIIIGVVLLEPQTWMIVPGICIGLVLIAIFVVIKSVVTTFISAGWTLAFREMTGMNQKMLETAAAE